MAEGLAAGATCARCLAGKCGHQSCRTPGFGMESRTQVAGTSCCEDCAPVLLELVLHPLRVVELEAERARARIPRYAPLCDVKAMPDDLQYAVQCCPDCEMHEFPYYWMCGTHRDAAVAATAGRPSDSLP